MLKRDAQWTFDDYARKYPGARKWLVQCAGCHRIGHSPEMPDTSRFARLRGAVNQPLEVDDLGFCPQCAAGRTLIAEHSQPE